MVGKVLIWQRKRSVGCLLVVGCEQIPSVNKTNSISGQHSRKCSLPPGSSYPPMAQWVGQRPHKISRTRRANVVSPVSNHKEAQLPFENGEPSGLTAREASAGTGMPHFPKELPNGTQQLKVKHDVNSPPVGPSESEESGALENRKGTSDGSIEEKSMNPNDCPILITKKNRLVNKEDLRDGVQRQGRTARCMTSSRGSISPTGEKLETPPSKPIKSSANCLGQPPASNSPDLPSESDNDREELLAAASAACNFSYLSCSGPFWKKAEPFFAPISLEDLSYLKQQSNPDEQQKDLTDFSSRTGDDMEDLLRSYQWKGIDGNEIFSATECLRGFGDQGLDDSSYGNYEIRNVGASLYQRLLSAFIIEDECEGNCIGSIQDPILYSLKTMMQRFLKNDAGDSEVDCLYEQMSLEDKLRMELQTVGLCPETVIPIFMDGFCFMYSEHLHRLSNSANFICEQCIKSKWHRDS